MKENLQWDTGAVIEELKRRCSANKSIKFSDGVEDDAFKDAVFEHFGGWTTALAAAGLHPKTKLLNCWNETEVLKRLRQIAERGDSINTLSLEINHPRLWNAARRIFGNIRNAVEAAGYDYSEYKKRGAWTPEKITAMLRDYHARGVDLSQITMIEEDSKLLAAAQKLYGAWSRAVRAAGIDYTFVKEHHREIRRNTKTANAANAQNSNGFFFQDGKILNPGIAQTGAGNHIEKHH